MKKKKILFMGVTFKENCSDIRNSKVFIISLFAKDNWSVDVYDPML